MESDVVTVQHFRDGLLDREALAAADHVAAMVQDRVHRFGRESKDDDLGMTIFLVQPDGVWLACNNIWWAGIYPSDIDRHCRSSDLIRLTDTDYEAARRLLEHPSDAYINNRVRDELGILLDRRAKVELDAISRDLPRLVDDYLPKKLFDSELVKL